MDLIKEILQKLGFDWKLALMNLINVGIIFFLLKKYLFATVSKKIEERRELIRAGVENATEAQTKLEMARLSSEKIIEDAKRTANDIIGNAVKESSSLAEDMRLRAVENVESIIAHAKQVIEAEKEQMHYELRKETAELVIEAVGKVLGEGVTESIDKQLTKRLISDLQKN
ncbi:MAG: F0F1 ATP synthase subunit B [Candidatus Magasanikbacteria bacterium]|nr:F0F1 ATP synthase subunit B [Candidatus Magasanikbacteria bacterium]